MSDLVRLDPFNEMMNGIVDGIFMRPAGSRFIEDRATFKVDISEEDTAYRLWADLPGLSKDAIDVAIEGNKVTVSAEAKPHQVFSEGQRLIRSERPTGKLLRVVAFEREIDAARAEARYHDGVLELVLPKIEAAIPKRLAIR